MPVADGPAITPEMLIIAAMLEEVRERKGPEWCKRRGLCAIRRRVSTPNIAVVSGVPSATVAEYVAAHRSAQAALAAFCRTCQGCPLDK